MSNAIVEVHNLRKTYGKKVAVADLSFSVSPGEIFGVLGPNGSGKSTASSASPQGVNCTVSEVLAGSCQQNLESYLKQTGGSFTAG